MNHLNSWKALEKHASEIKQKKLTDFFSEQQERGLSFSCEAKGIYLDYSKNHLSRTTLNLLKNYADEIQLSQKTESLFLGKHVNQSEAKSALHCSLRDFENINKIDPKIHAEIIASQKKALTLAENINSGVVTNAQKQPFKHLVCFGIGGSYLGPKLVFDALKNFHNTKLTVHFVASIDDAAFEKVVGEIDLKNSIFLIASKSFGTSETLANAEYAKKLLVEHGIQQCDLKQHFIAATENIQAALDFGCQEAFILPIWNFIGGRFSLWSSIGFPSMIALGTDSFNQLLKGAFELDQHFLTAPFENNLPILLGCISFWYQTFLKVNNRAIIPYSYSLKLLPAFLQQLEMESLGKSFGMNGELLDYSTGAIIWGSEGPNYEHAFHQLLLQGSHKVCTDFMIVKPENKTEKQNRLASQCFAQSAALAFGNAENNFQNVPGNQSSNTLILDSLDPHSLGSLLALYEHKTFVLASLLNINAFDQWGVHFGKATTKSLETYADNQKRTQLDSSTSTLLKKFFN